MDDVVQAIRATMEQNLGLFDKCFQEVSAGLESKEKQLSAVQESAAESSKELDLRRESIEELFKQLEKKEEELKAFQLVQEEGIRDLELKSKEIGSLLESVKFREDKLQFVEKEIERLFENIELERKNVESIQKSIEKKFQTLREERHVEETSGKSELEIELRKNILDAREEMLVAKEKELEAKEKILNLKTGKLGQPEVHNSEPGDLGNRSRKRGRRDSDGEFIHRANEQISASPEASRSSGNSSSRSIYVETEFNDFDEIRNEKCFSVNQFWATYCSFDGLPTKYAQIREVSEEEFKLRISWLENDLRSSWKYEGEKYFRNFPVVCKFKRGSSEEITDRLIFSHPIQCEQFGKVEGPYVIYPRRGEIWAVFKHQNARNFKIVEVLSDFDKNGGLNVVYLEKIRGYVSLFKRADQNAAFMIPAKEMRRFSHQIPSYRINGTEARAAPRGSFELDTAALA